MQGKARLLPCLVLAALFLLGGCAVKPPVVDQDEWVLTGKLSLRHSGESQIANIDWRYSAGVSNIDLSGVLGLGRVRIVADASQIRVLAGGEEHLFSPGEQLEVDGRSYRLPWHNLAYWVRGQQMTGEPLPEEFQTGDWTVRMLEDAPDGPRLLTLSHPDIELRLRILRWQLPAE